MFALIDAANTPTTSPSYYADMEAQVDTEEWMRLSAMEHATGDWDSFFTQNQWNMYCYKPTMGKWTALKWDWNITLGGGTQTWGPDASQLFNVGSNDPIMGAFQTYTPYRRAYLRALQDIANLAMNNSVVNPLLEAKYAAFAANGLTNAAYGLVVQDPAGTRRTRRVDRHHAQLALNDLDEPRREQRPLRDQIRRSSATMWPRRAARRRWPSRPSSSTASSGL